ncbi:MAG: transglutaminase domain-containing protein, partial [Clostridium sp.]|nr:transglutaminase domain-containing protein [Clostridium sp.]
MEEIVTDGMTNRQKAVTIRDYLKSTYSYTLSPGELPEGQDFVDDFLFETQEGYCVYFGTALTMMLRISGVPTRYIEGFKMGNEQVNVAYVVRNSDAHA